MRKRRISPFILFCFGALTLFYIYYQRTRPIDNYALVFDHLIDECSLENCALTDKMSLAHKAVYHDPTFSRGYQKLGAYFEALGEAEKARALHEQAVLMDHKNSDSLLRLGKYHLMKNDLELASRYLKKSYSVSWADDIINYYMGRLYEKEKNFSEAAKYYLRAYQYNTDNLYALARLGAVETFLGGKTRSFEHAQVIRKKGNEELARSLEEYAQLTSYEEFRPNDK